MAARIAFLAPPLLLLATACQADLKCGPLEVDHVRRLCVCPNGGEHRDGLCYGDGSVTPLDGMIVGDAGPMLEDAGPMFEDAGPMFEDAGEMVDAHVDVTDAGTDACAAATYHRDADGDGFGDPAAATTACERPDGYVEDDTDCDDDCAECNPDASEVCDGRNNDCDAATDEGVLTTFYRDADADGFGNRSMPTSACERPTGYVEDGTDCDDGCAECNPDASEVCDGRNNDCDAAIDEGVLTTFYRDADGDGFGTSAMAMQACVAPAGHVTQSGDCNDGCAVCFPGNAEVCDGLDNDCAGGVDDGVRTTYYADCDGDGYAAEGGVSTAACEEPVTGPVGCTTGMWTTRPPTAGQVDCLDTNPSVRPGQTSFFSEPISGVPLSQRWDYDCDGTTTFQVTRVDVGLACGGSVACSARSGWAGSSVPVCGATADYVLCAMLTPAHCTSLDSPRARQQRCR